MKFFIKTYGCQMNQADSEKIAVALEQKGYKPAESYKNADVVIINTCSVRQSAEDRVLGLMNNINKLKVKSVKCKVTVKSLKLMKPKVILTGCMLRYPLSKLKAMLPGVNEFKKLKDLTPSIHNSKFIILNSPLSAEASAAPKAWVKIMEGCDNFCTYCVVPYSRGSEVSRPMEEIYCEVCELVKRGVKEITLLGQNVNSYGKNQFAKLLQKLHSIKGLKKISFLTSNPQDLTDDIIKVMKLPKIDRYLHLPVQSGDDEILKKMNRKYTTKQYLELIKKIRHAIPGINIGTDIIVGFPGETREQFQHTVDLCKKVGFKVAYIAKYSRRSGTAAFKLKDNVPPQEKKRRWEKLNKLINPAPEQSSVRG